MKYLSLLLAFIVIPTLALAQSTSPNPDPLAAVPQTLETAGDPAEIITFSEFPVGTFISDQYSDRGIIFGGDNPFISTDAANPTSPVLSGSPRFFGAIAGDFVAPVDGATPAIVESFSLDAGFFDELGSTRIEWFEPDGQKLGQRTNSQNGIESFLIEGGNIASWRISIQENEPAGYAIDNFSSKPVQASMLFREKRESDKDGSWGFGGDEVPGFDHVAFQRNNLVFESHPGYPSGTYVSEDGTETASVAQFFGIQAQHTKETFKHDLRIGDPRGSPVIDFEEIPIDAALAVEIENKMQALSGGFQGIDFSSFEGIELTLSPAAQKGGGGTFTCVGFVEFAAEQAGHNSGQGFVRNAFESFTYLDPNVFPPVLRTAPLLSPQLLNYSMKGAANINSILQWFQGLLDPVDFIITDPLGRRLGHSNQLGEINEIPKAFFSGDGELEQFLIPNPVAGTYTVELIGLGDQVAGAVASSLREIGINEFLAVGETDTFTFEIALVVGGPGDVNRDGLINQQDVDELNTLLNTFTNDPNDPGDINGDGLLSIADVALLEELISGGSVRKVEIDIMPGSDNNPINLTSSVIPVAILTTSVASGDEMDFDAAQVAASSLTLSGAASLAKGRSGNFGSLEDVDGDGDQDLVVQFPTAELQLAEVDNKLVLEGETLDGTAIMGMDFIEVVPAE